MSRKIPPRCLHEDVARLVILRCSINMSSTSHSRYMKSLPTAVRVTYPFDLFRRGGAEHTLLDKTTLANLSTSALHRDIVQVRYRTAGGGFVE